MNTRTLVINLSAVLMSAVHVAAQTDSWSVDRVVQEALDRSALLRTAAADARAADARRRVARAPLLPSVEARAGWTASNDPVFAFGTKLRQSRFDGADLNIDALNDPGRVVEWSAGIGVSWSILAPATWARKDAATSQAEAARWGRARVEDRVVFEARVLFYSAVAARARLQATQASEAAKLEAVRVIRGRVTQGLATEAELLGAQAELDGARAERLDGDRALSAARSRLAAFLSISLEDLPQLTHGSESDRSWTSQEFDAGSRADLRALRSEFESAEAVVAASRGQRLPSVQTFAAWNRYAGGPFSDGRGRWTAGVGLSLPLFTGFEAQSQVEAAVASAEAARIRLEQATREAFAEHGTALRDVEAAQDIVRASRSAATAAEEAERLAKRRFEEGLSVALDLLDAQARAARFRLRAVEAETRYQIALARLAWVGASEEN